MVLSTNSGFVKLPFLLDTGAQISLVNRDAISPLKPEETCVQLPLKGLEFRGKRLGYLSCCDLILPSDEKLPVQIFALENLNIDITVEGMDEAIETMKSLNFPVSPSVPKYNRNYINLAGITGNDILTNFQVFEYVTKNGISFARIANGFVPVGSIQTLKMKLKSYETKSSQFSKVDMSDVDLSNNQFF